MSKISPAQLSTIRKLITGKLSPETFASVTRRINECYNRPGAVDLILTACNEVLDGHGVEAIRGSWVDGYYGDTCAVYVNMGDTYDQTVVYDTRKGKYIITSCGDWVESAPKYYGVL
jgi:hypothetical protein